jgi:hypothetical protein
MPAIGRLGDKQSVGEIDVRLRLRDRPFGMDSKRNAMGIQDQASCLVIDSGYQGQRQESGLPRLLMEAQLPSFRGFGQTNRPPIVAEVSSVCCRPNKAVALRFIRSVRSGYLYYPVPGFPRFHLAYWHELPVFFKSRRCMSMYLPACSRSVNGLSSACVISFLIQGIDRTLRGTPRITCRPRRRNEMDCRARPRT